MIIIRTTSGRICEVELVTRGEKTAAKVTWHVDPRDPETAEDQQEVVAVLSAMTGTKKAGWVDLGAVSTEMMDAAANRYLKAEEN